MSDQGKHCFVLLVSLFPKALRSCPSLAALFYQKAYAFLHLCALKQKVNPDENGKWMKCHSPLRDWGVHIPRNKIHEGRIQIYLNIWYTNTLKNIQNSTRAFTRELPKMQRY